MDPLVVFCAENLNVSDFTNFLQKLLFFCWLFIVALTARSYRDCHLLGMSNCESSNFTAIYRATSEVVHHFVDNNGLRSRETLTYGISSGIWGPTLHLSLKIIKYLVIFRLRKPLKTSTRLNLGPPECESRALPRCHLAR